MGIALVGIAGLIAYIAMAVVVVSVAGGLILAILACVILFFYGRKVKREFQAGHRAYAFNLLVIPTVSITTAAVCAHNNLISMQGFWMGGHTPVAAMVAVAIAMYIAPFLAPYLLSRRFGFFQWLSFPMFLSSTYIWVWMFDQLKIG